MRLPLVRDVHPALCDDLVERLADAGIRAGVDDRDETVGEHPNFTGQ